LFFGEVFGNSAGGLRRHHGGNGRHRQCQDTGCESRVQLLLHAAPVERRRSTYTIASVNADKMTASPAKNKTESVDAWLFVGGGAAVPRVACKPRARSARSASVSCIRASSAADQAGGMLPSWTRAAASAASG